MADDGMNPTRRNLIGLTTGLGAVGFAFAATPFVLSMQPSARAKAAGAPVEVDFSDLGPGKLKIVEWRGKPVWILHRTKEMLESLKKTSELVVDPESKVESQQPHYAQNEHRSIKPELLVLIGLCTHLGCSPQTTINAGALPKYGLDDDWPGGFFCPCHGSKFDLAGRVYKNVPAPTNLPVPPHVFLSENHILIGEDQVKGGNKGGKA